MVKVASPSEKMCGYDNDRIILGFHAKLKLGFCKVYIWLFRHFDVSSVLLFHCFCSAVLPIRCLPTLVLAPPTTSRIFLIPNDIAVLGSWKWRMRNIETRAG